jgi:hypothetical protein
LLAIRSGGVRLIVGLLVLSAALGAAERRVDHSAFPVLKGPFKDGPAVTKACLSCHAQAGQEILQTPHWLWKGEETVVPGHDGKPRRIGKANLINNFCIGVQSNEASCTRCHIGYGWKDKTFDFKDATKIDCLVCHDTTGDYTRQPSADEPLDWARLAKKVGPTSVATCGSCHFQGGGGEGVKHGDLDPTLLEAGRGLDLHLAKDGLGFTCSTCHRGEDNPHLILGHSASVSTQTGDNLSCARCHGESPHGRPFVYRTAAERKAGEALRASRPARPPLPSAEADRLNWHARRIACQTCHVPAMARAMPTKTYWDWSTAGRHDADGEPVDEMDEEGNHTYLAIKGSFTWEKNVVPDYRWYDGRQNRYLLGDKIGDTLPLPLNQPLGGPETPGAKIWPFKVMRGKQIYDTENDYLIQPKLSGEKGSGAYWKDFNWDRAARVGMAYAGLPYSGKYDFVETEMFWPLAHMNVEGGAALSCRDCHRRDGRLRGVPGVYIPGQHRFRWLDVLGWIGVGASLLGVLIHAPSTARWPAAMPCSRDSSPRWTRGRARPSSLPCRPPRWPWRAFRSM